MSDNQFWWNFLKVSGSFTIALVALFGDYFRSKLFKIKLVIDEIEGHKTSYQNNKSVYYFNGVVCNEKKNISGKNVRVILRRVATKDKNNTFLAEDLPGDTTFIWTPANNRPQFISLSTYDKFDFGYLNEKTNKFIPSLNIHYHNTNITVGKDETKRYELLIKADNYFKEEKFYYEVTYNGKYDENQHKMLEENIIVKKVNSLT